MGVLGVMEIYEGFKKRFSAGEKRKCKVLISLRSNSHQEKIQFWQFEGKLR
jgi:hypothetical protein